MSGPPDPSTKRVLVVDDFAVILRMVRRPLEANGYYVAGADSFEKATKLLRQEPFDVLITDVYMPDGDGFDILSHARTNFPDLKVVVMSGRFSMDSHGRSLMRSFLDLGAMAALTKPFEIHELLDTIGLALLASHCEMTKA